MKKQLLTLFFTLTAFALVFAQGGKIQFEKELHDFGTIKEDGGPVSYEFKVTNSGTAPLIISNVQPSCGCTTPGWSKEPIMPGKTGFIKAQFDPMNRPGTFNKTLTVVTNGEPSSTMLTIKGTVTPKAKTAADELPEKMGALRMGTKFFQLGKVSNKEPFVKQFTLLNDGDKPMTFKEVNAPSHIKLAFQPQTLNPGEKGTVVVTYDAKAKNDLGYLNDGVTFYTDEASGSRKDISIVANVEDYFPPMSPEELAKAPKLAFNKKEYDFGAIKEGVVVTTDFVFTNSGKQDLVIKKTKANCGCTTSELTKKVLKPGESSVITVSYNSKGKKGADNKEVAVFSNDPSAPVQTLRIKTVVETEEASAQKGK